MRTIRNQLVLLLVCGTIALITAAGAGLYGYMDEVLKRSLDAALAAKSEAIMNAVHVGDDGSPQLQLGGVSASPAIRREAPFFFQIWRDDATTLARFVPPGVADLPRVIHGRRTVGNAELSDGTWVRLTETLFQAHAEKVPTGTAPRASKFPATDLMLVVAHDRRSVDGPLAVLLTGLTLAAGLVSAGIVVVVTWGVSRGLRPLADMSRLADRIGPDTLDIRFPGGRDGLPVELLPIGQKLNDLLDRLSAAFARERRFSAAVAHELRTPLAELRSACDVALMWPEDRSALLTAVSEARDIAVQMSALTQTLLTLARQHAGIEPAPPFDSVNLSAAVAEVLSPLQTDQASRQLNVHQELDGNATVATDPEILRVVLRNLLKNALEYSPAQGSVVITTENGPAGYWRLRIANTCAGLNAAELPRLWEPFWRADVSGTGPSHSGLGLTLVKTYCDAVGIRVNVALISGSMIEFTLQLGKKL